MIDCDDVGADRFDTANAASCHDDFVERSLRPHR
jgi:hypothetical protein